MNTPPLLASHTSPISIYYCKAGIQTGQTIRVLQNGIVHTCSSIRLESRLDTGPFDASMTHDNAKGKPKASGARCVLILNCGLAHLDPSTE